MAVDVELKAAKALNHVEPQVVVAGNYVGGAQLAVHGQGGANERLRALDHNRATRRHRVGTRAERGGNNTPSPAKRQ